MLHQEFFSNDQASSQQERPVVNGDSMDTEIGERVMP